MRRTPAALAALALACAPGTTRPAFRPLPQALTAELRAAPDRVTTEISGWLQAEGLRVEWASPRDGYLETAWFDTETRRPVDPGTEAGSPARTVKIRCWADPGRPGMTQLTVEAVYRPIDDPSRLERDLELAVPLGQEGHRLAERLITALRDKFGGPP